MSCLGTIIIVSIKKTCTSFKECVCSASSENTTYKNFCLLKLHHHLFLRNLGPCKATPWSALAKCAIPSHPWLGACACCFMWTASTAGIWLLLNWAFAYVWRLPWTCLFLPSPAFPEGLDSILWGYTDPTPTPHPTCLFHGKTYISVVRLPVSASLYHPLDCGLLNPSNTALCGLLLHTPGTVCRQPCPRAVWKYRTWTSQGFGDWLLQSNTPCFREHGSLLSHKFLGCEAGVFKNISTKMVTWASGSWYSEPISMSDTVSPGGCASSHGSCSTLNLLPEVKSQVHFLPDLHLGKLLTSDESFLAL